MHRPQQFGTMAVAVAAAWQQLLYGIQATKLASC